LDGNHVFIHGMLKYCLLTLQGPGPVTPFSDWILFSTFTFPLLLSLFSRTATLIAIVLNVGVFPGVLGCIGNVLVIVGTLAVIYPSAMEEDGDSGDDK
jgi:hypothetical protein